MRPLGDAAMLERMLAREAELRAELKEDDALPVAEPSKVQIQASV